MSPNRHIINVINSIYIHVCIELVHKFTNLCLKRLFFNKPSVDFRQVAWAPSRPPTFRPVGSMTIWCFVNKDYIKVLILIRNIYVCNTSYMYSIHIISHNLYVYIICIKFGLEFLPVVKL